MKRYNHYSDADLVALYKSGDQLAFSIIYERYWERIYYTAVKKLRDEAEAQESVQDIFYTMWKNREQFQLRESLENYLAVAVKYQVIQRLAKARRRSEIVESLSLAAQRETSSPAEWTQYDLNLLQARLTNEIEQLPKKCKLVFKMSRDEDFTNKKIAAALGISEKAVEKHITHALKVLRTSLGPKATLILIVGQVVEIASVNK